MILLKTLPVLLAGFAILPAHADGAGRADKSGDKQIAVDLKSCAKPEWPRESLRFEQQGSVTLAYLIGLDGSVLDSKVEKSSGYPLLDLAAQDGIAKCKFTPPNSVGRSEPTWTRMQYVWKLEERKTPAQQQAELASDRAKAAQGDAAALFRMSARYMQGKQGLERNVEEAVRMLRQSAELGHAEAQEALGMLLTAGKHVPQDATEGRMWTEKAAAQGAAHAQLSLGIMLLGGHEGPEGTVRGRTMLESSAAQGNVMAKVVLGNWLIREGSEVDLGLKLVEEAAERHDRMAQFTLAEVLEKGELRTQDMARALALYQRAAAAGFPPAKRAIARLAAQAPKDAN